MLYHFLYADVVQSLQNGLLTQVQYDSSLQLSFIHSLKYIIELIHLLRGEVSLDDAPMDELAAVRCMHKAFSYLAAICNVSIASFRLPTALPLMFN